jgi:hypothetical protein
VRCWASGSRAARRPPSSGGGLDGDLQLGRVGPAEREQEGEPGRLLDVGLGGDRLVRPGGSSRVRGRADRQREALRVGRAAQAGHERVAVAVVGGAVERAW